jgi:hypothetical protein
MVTQSIFLLALSHVRSLTVSSIYIAGDDDDTFSASFELVDKGKIFDVVSQGRYPVVAILAEKGQEQTAPVPGGRLAVKDVVRLAPGGDPSGCLGAPSEKIIGVIVKDDEDRQPFYVVHPETGNTHYYGESDLVIVERDGSSEHDFNFTADY